MISIPRFTIPPLQSCTMNGIQAGLKDRALGMMCVYKGLVPCKQVLVWYTTKLLYNNACNTNIRMLRLKLAKNLIESEEQFYLHLRRNTFL